MSKPFPKAWALGNRNTNNIFEDPVELTEKIDGSQFAFGKIDGKLIIRSKRVEIQNQLTNSMFSYGLEYIRSIEDELVHQCMYYAEYLKQRKHNVLTYDMIPKNHMALFGIVYSDDTIEGDRNFLEEEAERLGIDIVPVLYYGMINDEEQLKKFLEKESYLGGTKIEGVVIKNYHKDIVFGGQWVDMLQAKYVSERFKEVAGVEKKANSSKGQLESLIESYRTEARWLKALFSLRDSGQLLHDPKDIGQLVKMVQGDIIEEEKEEIKAKLFEIYNKQIMRHCVKGLPEWYKERLLSDSFKESGDE